MSIPPLLAINVTQDDIDNGTRQDGFACPITLATRRQLDTHDIEAIYTDCERIDIEHWDHDSRYPLPAFVRDWIADFDRGEDVSPISFVTLSNPWP